MMDCKHRLAKKQPLSLAVFSIIARTGPEPCYSSYRIRSATETVVYSKSLQKPRTLWHLLQALGPV